MQAHEVGEVGVQPLPQGLGLPHIDHPAARITEPVHPRGFGDGSRARPVACRICHAVRLRPPSDARGQSHPRARVRPPETSRTVPVTKVLPARYRMAPATSSGGPTRPTGELAATPSK